MFNVCHIRGYTFLLANTTQLFTRAFQTASLFDWEHCTKQNPTCFTARYNSL